MRNETALGIVIAALILMVVFTFALAEEAADKDYQHVCEAHGGFAARGVHGGDRACVALLGERGKP